MFKADNATYLKSMTKPFILSIFTLKSTNIFIYDSNWNIIAIINIIGALMFL